MNEEDSVKALFNQIKDKYNSKNKTEGNSEWTPKNVSELISKISIRWLKKLKLTNNIKVIDAGSGYNNLTDEFLNECVKEQEKNLKKRSEKKDYFNIQDYKLYEIDYTVYSLSKMLLLQKLYNLFQDIANGQI